MTPEMKVKIIESLKSVSQIDCYKVAIATGIDVHDCSMYLDVLATIKILKVVGFSKDGAEIYRLNN